MASIPDAKVAISKTATVLANRVRAGEVNESAADAILRQRSEDFTDSLHAAWIVFDYGTALFHKLREHPQ